MTPADHGIVGNGWYFRDLGEVFLWRQHNKLVQGEKVWETARRAKPGFRVANLCWWYAMGASDRPDGHAAADLPRRRRASRPTATRIPPQLHDNLTGPLGEFPLFQYWGPTANIKSTKWIADATKIVLDKDAARHAAGLSAAPRLRPPALRARGPGGAERGARARRGRWAT